MPTALPITTTARPALLPISTRKRRFNVQVLQIGRQIHLYVGVFSAPALLFFAFSGALQTFSLHEADKERDYKPANWIIAIGQLHKHQTTQRAIGEAQPLNSSPSPRPAAAAGTEQFKAAPNEHAATQMKGVGGSVRHPLPMKIFFATISLSLLFSVLTGLYMSYRHNRNKIIVTCFLLSGLLIPSLLTFL